MTEEEKKPVVVSEFAERRRRDKKAEIPAAIKTQSDTGGDQGTFDRPPCGDCIHWKKNPAQGVGFGNCMMMPPVIMTVAMQNAQPGAINVRPGMRANAEGCDQFEDADGNGVFDDEEGDDPDDGIPAPRLATG